MPSFDYSALSASGQNVTGQLQAQSRADVFRKLEAQALTPVRVMEQANPKQAAATASKSTQSLQPVKLKRAQLILFTEELADLLDGGLQMDQALRVMQERQEAVAIRAVSAILREQLREGSTVAKALRKASPSFDELYCNLVAAGEVTGSLSSILRRLASNLTVMADLQSKVTQALIYPLFLIGACSVLMIVFMTFMVPQITDLLGKSGQQLPAATQALIKINSFVGTWWWVILTVTIIAGLLFKGHINSPKGKLWWHRTKLRLPLFGPVIATRFYAQFAHSLANLVNNGVPLLNSIKLVANISANVFIQSILSKVGGFVADGAPLSTGLRKAGEFPMMLVDMIAVGEQTGNLGHSLEKCAVRYDKELDKRIKRMTALISPVILIIMAVVVGIVAYSIVTAIFQSVSGIRSRA